MLKQVERFEVSDVATIYGCCGLFDMCTDNDLMSLSMEGANKFLDWIGWELTSVCLIKKNFITYVRAERTQGVATPGYISDPCGESNGAEWGKCDFVLEDWGRYRRHGPVRDATRINTKYCEQQPMYRLDGSRIVNDDEYDMRVATEAIVQDLKRAIITGNATTAGQFDGLQRLVKTGYTDSTGYNCDIMDSIVIDWNSNQMAGGAGMTWNGAAIAATYNFVDVLQAVVRRIKDRIDMAPPLASQPMLPGDMVFVAPTHVIRCLLDHYTCWSVCEGSQYNEVAIQSYEARTFRRGLDGGLFNMGKIFIDGFEIPMLAYNWSLTNNVTGDADAYLLTGKVGSVQMISGQMLDMRKVPPTYPKATYSYTDGGRLLTWSNQDQTCMQREVEFQPRLLMWAPWAQARFQDIECNTPGGVLSPDPWETSFFPESSFCIPACP